MDSRTSEVSGAPAFCEGDLESAVHAPTITMHDMASSAILLIAAFDAGGGNSVPDPPSSTQRPSFLFVVRVTEQVIERVVYG
jgi:hypothetical protein